MFYHPVSLTTRLFDLGYIYYNKVYIPPVLNYKEFIFVSGKILPIVFPKKKKKYRFFTYVYKKEIECIAEFSHMNLI